MTVRPIGKNKDRFQADFLFNGKRQRPSFGSRREAELYEREAKKAEKLDLPLPDPKNFEEGWTIGDFVDTHFDAIWPLPERKDYARKQIDHVLKLIDRDTPLSTINSQTILAMEMELRKQGRKEATINKKKSPLNMVLQFAEDYEFISRKPKIRFSKEDNAREVVALSAEDETKLLGYFVHIGAQPAYWLTVFLLYTGCRLGEAMKLEWGHVMPDLKTVVFYKTKNGDNRQVPMSQPAQDALQYAKDQGFHKPFPLSRHTYRDQWNKARGWMGQRDNPNFVIHMLRHTCNTRLYAGGVPEALIRKWIGHKTPSMSMRYTHLVPENLGGGVEVLNQWR